MASFATFSFPNVSTPMGFGFGFNPAVATPSWQPSPFSAISTFSSSSTQPVVRVQKRRHEEDESPSSDHAMDRSPTPERPKRAAPKRARVATDAPSGKDDKEAKENKAPSPSEEPQVDVGMLLASLPPESLLPLLTSLLATHPALKPAVLALIPRPTLDSALHSLSASARKLRDAYPYSSNSVSQTTFGFGAMRAPFGQPSAQQPSGMRDSYISSRLQVPINDFVSTTTSYLPYFSFIPSSANPQTIHKHQLHPNETFQFLLALTNHIRAQPPLAQAELIPYIRARLDAEWKAWLDKVDTYVNREAGMFTEDVVRTWEKALDEAAASAGEIGEIMRPIRDVWIAKQCGYRYRFARTKVHGLATNPVIVGCVSMFLFTSLVILASFVTTFFMSWFEDPSYSTYYYTRSGWFWSWSPFYVSPFEVVQDIIRAALRILQDEDAETFGHAGGGGDAAGTGSEETYVGAEPGIIRSLIRRFFLGLPIIGASSVVQMLLSLPVMSPLHFLARYRSNSRRRENSRDIASLIIIGLILIGAARALIKVYSFTEQLTKRLLLRAEDAILEAR
ncbi:hypothetical protein MKEN_00791000 [Mycena kentingensis (nom. inval.)]|nr:hypothetical protein MKEN_00791000 [Mycena kentingensis (nom. inval.)]